MEECAMNNEAAIKLYSTLIFYVNGIEVVEKDVDPAWSLLHYLRNKLKLCGTKLGCGEGGCGACTVIVSKIIRESKKIIHFAVNSCLMPICALHGMAVITVEGIGNTKTKLHPVQERIAKAHGSQCGFCTPGFVMSMYALLRSTPKPVMQDLENAFQGNLCRCTGYRPIIEGYKTFTTEWEQSRLCRKSGTSYSNMNNSGICYLGDECCRIKTFTSEDAVNELFDYNEFQPHDPSQELIFPPKLQLSSELDDQYLMIRGNGVTWYRPTTFLDLLKLKDEYPNAKIVVGNTEVGIEVKYKHLQYPVLIYPTLIKALSKIMETENGLRIGASVTLNEMETSLREQIQSKPGYQTRVFSEIIEILHWFAGKQIRNVAAVGGNIMTSSPISDLNPIFIAAGVELTVCSLKRGFITITMDETFFTGYRKNIIASDEILVSIEIPFSQKVRGAPIDQFASTRSHFIRRKTLYGTSVGIFEEYFVAYKQARRREDDITIVNMALNVVFQSQSNIVKSINIAFGGMGATTIVAKTTCKALIGMAWNMSNLEVLYDNLIEELPLSSDAPGGMVPYRRSLTLSLFLKAFIRVSKQLERSLKTTELIPTKFRTADENFCYNSPKSSQYFQVIPEGQKTTDLIGRPIIHASALKQATGEAIYCDDIPKYENELYLSLVVSTKSHAKITKIDATKALAIKGVVAFFSATDLSAEQLRTGYLVKDEEIFVSETVRCEGLPIGAIVADEQSTAQKASRLVKVEYEELKPLILTIEDAITRASFFPGCPKSLTVGNIEEAFSKSDHVLEGEIKSGAQEHFYLETQAVLVIPKENELEIICSTQQPAFCQKTVSEMLNLDFNLVTVKTKRIGGGFGGKESRCLSTLLPAALAAYRLRKPVRCMLDRDEDMIITGTRHPFLSKYKVGFNKNGLLNVIDVTFYCNAGCSFDASTPVLERAMLHVDNSYKIPAVKLQGYICRTNLPSNTAFRGFGGPQGMFVTENIIRHVAYYLAEDEMKIAQLNLYNEGEATHFHQILYHCTLRACWNECLQLSNYSARRQSVEKFNRENRYKKKGIAIVPTKFGVGFSEGSMNQGCALINIYVDGSVLITHGGVEMGQGLHTKVIQVASRELQVNPNRIHISETATDKIPNATATAGSLSSDLYGMSTLLACQKIMKRIKPIIEKNPKGSWEEWIQQAYLERISLTATGYYRIPDIGYNFRENSGKPYDYFTYGVACSEVIVDCLTGDHQVLRTDIVMDLGESLNPAIDIGQVEGGFMQGYGLFTLEEVIVSPQGSIRTRGPSTYKLPGLADIPREFNVSLLKGTSNPRAVYSSKAVGEPPLFLASSIFFAIKEAIKAARKDVNNTSFFRLDAPATVERIRMACIDDLTEKVGEPDDTTP